MVEVPPVTGETTPPLLYSLYRYHDSPLLVVCRYTDRRCFPTHLSLGCSSCKSLYYIIGSFPNAPHDLLCLLNGNSLINLYCSSVTPGIMAYPDEPGDTT